MKAPEIDSAIERIKGGDRQPLYLVIGEQVLAMREATRIAEALASASGCSVEVHKGVAGAEVRSVLADLCTFSLFESAKVAVVSETDLFADKDAAADLIDKAARVLDDEGSLVRAAGEPLLASERSAAGQLLQVLRLHGVDPMAGSAAETIAALPDAALSGGKNLRKSGRRGRLKKERVQLARGLTDLLEAAQTERLSGWSEDDLAALHRAQDGGLPEGHALVFAERSVDRDHPIVRRLVKCRAVFKLGLLGFDRNGNVVGLDPIVAELERETGVRIDGRAAEELARRTLRKGDGWGSSEAEANSAARFSAEYRKLADGVRGLSNRIDRAAVSEMVTDRGEEDAWKLLDAIGQEGPAKALEQLRRLLDTAPDQSGAVFPFFGLLAGFCQHMAAIHGVLARVQLPTAYNFNAFKSRVLPQLKGELPESVAKIAPFRLFKAYRAASLRQGPEADRMMAKLPWKVLETDIQIRGGTDDRTVALEALVAMLAGGVTAGADGSSPGRGGLGGRPPSRRTDHSAGRRGRRRR